MNSKQEAKLNMFDAVLTHCKKNAAIILTVPAFQIALVLFFYTLNIIEVNGKKRP